ncbi:hypothetical protein Hdeb2414_s0383g00881841 [Helianthus debilis subsp. tardiflorus]
MHLHFGSVPTLIAPPPPPPPEATQEILKTHDSLFASRPNLTIPNILLYGCKDISFSPCRYITESGPLLKARRTYTHQGTEYSKRS